jgi:4-methyl-5(b-hydroxyethyl)-thiazole monophosphate biosynthesis
MPTIYEFLADGFEEIEGMAPVDIFRRGGLDVKTVSVNGTNMVKTSHGVTVVADTIFENVNFDDAVLLMLPGGMPGSTNLNAHAGVRAAMKKQYVEGKLVAAICAAPMVLGSIGILRGKKATCSPGFEKYLDGATYTSELCTVDGNVITGKGPAATLPYAYKLLEILTDSETSRTIQHKMQFLQLIGEE